MPSWLLNWFNEHVLQPEVSGLAGAALGALNTPGSSKWEKLLNFAAGICAAWFLTPAITEYFAMQTQSAKMAAAFIVGLVGMNLLSKIIDHVRRSKLSDLLSRNPTKRK